MQETYKVHAFYILLILLAVIIGLVTVKWNEIPNLPALITFALTVTSLVLALLAIIYAYVSNFSFQQTTAVLSRAADDVLKSAGEVRRATEQLGTQVQGIPTLLKSVGERVEQTHTLLMEYSTKQASNVPIVEAGSVSSKDLAERFLTNSSVTGLFGLLAMKFSIEKKKTFSLAQFAERTAVGVSDYMYGFLVAGSSAGIVSYSGGADDILGTELNDIVAAKLEGELVRHIQTLSDPEHRTRLFTAIETTRSFFEDAAPAAPAA